MEGMKAFFQNACCIVPPRLVFSFSQEPDNPKGALARFCTEKELFESPQQFSARASGDSLPKFSGAGKQVVFEDMQYPMRRGSCQKFKQVRSLKDALKRAEGTFRSKQFIPELFGFRAFDLCEPLDESDLPRLV
jgi:hypothetical protein